MLDSGEVEAMLRDEPLKKRLREWATFDNGSVTARKLPNPPAAKPAGYIQKAYTLADHLEYLSDAAGIPVVADAFRLPVGGEEYMSASTVGEYIRSLRDQAMAPTRNAYFRTESGWLMARHPFFWRRVSDEIPESAFEPLEAKVAGGQMPTLDDYAAFAGSLTPWQALVFTNSPPLTRFPRLPLVSALPALRIWAALNASQRESASRDGLSLQEMTPAQRELYSSAALALLWQRPVKESFLPLLMRGDAPQDLRFFYQDGAGGYQGVVSVRSEELGDENRKTQVSLNDLGKLRDRTVAFLLGSDIESSESYGLLLPVKE
jgi:hypothetical protein